jgi:signal transduction histidine kinase
VAHLYAVSDSHDAPRPLRAIAHDLNNLLTAISGYGSLLATDARVPVDSQRDASEIVDAASRAVRLVRQLQLHA